MITKKTRLNNSFSESQTDCSTEKDLFLRLKVTMNQSDFKVISPKISKLKNIGRKAYWFQFYPSTEW